MAEVLGQKSLLGVGVLLAWLVLFHLLVNIWLLCVFTSLLVVLGGWLGSQAALDSNTVLHLERFISVDQITLSEEDEQQLDQEIHNTVIKIIRDFVTSWYSTVSTEKGFESDVHDAMISMAMELKRRARQVDRKELTRKIMDLFGCHLQDFLKAKQLVPELQRRGKWDSERMWRAYSSITLPHVATTSKGMEINYMRALVDLLLHVLVPSPHLETRSGRFVVGELITSNVMLPLIDRLSDPDWLNLFVITLFGNTGTEPDATDDKIQNTTTLLPAVESTPSLCDLTQETQQNIEVEAAIEREVPNNVVMPAPDLTMYDEFDCNDLDIPQNIEEDETVQPFLRHYLRGSKSNPFYQETDSDLDSPLTDHQQSSLDSLTGQEDGIGDKPKEAVKNNGIDLEDTADGPCPKVLVNSQPVVDTNGCVLLKTEGTTSNNQDLDKEGLMPPFNPNRDLPLGVEQAGLTSPNELTVVSPSQITSPIGSFSFEPLSSPEGPVIIQNLRITGTITAKEHRGTGSHPYTLYTIKYETAMGYENQESMQTISEEAEAPSGSDSPSSAQQIAYHMVNRRYSEFLNLQTRLEERSDLRKLIKGVKGPKKIFPDMPFGNMDSDKIEARKGLLEAFLKQLCTIPEIANSEEMQEFLALNTDARIAFVKKPFITSRIDKIVVNAIVDTLKTAFPRSEPQSPTDDTDEADGVRITTDKKNKSRLKFSTKNAPLMNGSDVRPTPPLFSFDQTRTVLNGMTLGDLEAFISDRERLALRQDSYTAESPAASETAPSSNNGSREKSSEESVSETALAEVTLDILCLLMREQWSWLCTQNIQRTIRLLFGTLLNRWLDVSVANLMCTSYWVTYLQVIQEAVWPGGTLPAAPEIVRTQQQKDATKQEALQCLMKLLPDLISDMLGSDKYKLSWQNTLDSLQDPYINRHLVYCIFDLLLEVLVPETFEEDFQKSLLQSLSKSPEKIQT